MPWATAWVTWSGPIQLMLVTFFQKASSVLRNGIGLSQPALLTSTSVPWPACSSKLFTAPVTAEYSVMSQGIANALPPADSMASAVAAALSALMSNTPTVMPSAPSRRAMALPMPLPAPVTMALLPFSPRMSKILAGAALSIRWQSGAPGRTS